MVRYETHTGRPRAGLASAMLETVPVRTVVPGYVKYAKEMHFTLPEDPAWPIIMIAAGSGIAPFRGFWMKRWEQHVEGHSVGKTLLYFGCRKKTMNLFKNETESVSISNQRSVITSSVHLTPLSLVFSRESSALMLALSTSNGAWPTPESPATPSSTSRT